MTRGRWCRKGHKEQTVAGSEAGGGNSGPRTRKGAQQRARDIVREGLGQLRDWGSEIVAEVRVLQANQPTSSTKTTATEAGGGTVQSQGAEQGRVRDHRTAREGSKHVDGQGCTGQHTREKPKQEQEQRGGEEEKRRVGAANLSQSEAQGFRVGPYP